MCETIENVSKNSRWMVFSIYGYNKVIIKKSGLSFFISKRASAVSMISWAWQRLAIHWR